MHKTFITIIVAVAACGGDPSEPAERPLVFGGDRPAQLKVPTGFTEGRQYPLVMVLHGFGANGFSQSAYFGVSALPTMDQAFLIAPDGTTNSQGQQFWNADPLCCDVEGQNPDDVAYLGGLIDDVSAAWPVDPGAVFVIGHSNGGFMAYRLACERADAIAAIMSLAGLASSVPASCNPTQPVSVLHLHGTADSVVPYDNGADLSVDQWAGKNGCAATVRTPGPVYDLDTMVAGAETQTAAIADCPAAGSVELWRLEGSSHTPLFGTAFAPQLMEWLTAHRR
ncbi:MAG TPA: PHB depolymerase family esterase [Kofleriaceae bacterium]|jgi:polyhydroxybutyrate depolymerase|nr:PHB depolymerase family esterase [Kofleriaceae bacterium]